MSVSLFEQSLQGFPTLRSKLRQCCICYLVGVGFAYFHVKSRFIAFCSLLSLIPIVIQCVQLMSNKCYVHRNVAFPWIRCFCFKCGGLCMWLRFFSLLNVYVYYVWFIDEIKDHWNKSSNKSRSAPPEGIRQGEDETERNHKIIYTTNLFVWIIDIYLQ